MEPVGTLGPVTAQNAVLLSKAGLQVIDPLTQQPRWSRDDITPDAELFGDDQLLLLYFPRAQEGKRGLALSMIDGTRVEGLDVVKFFNSRIDTCGRHVLLWDEGPATSVLRLFDPLQGRDLWKIQTPGKANLVKSFVPATVAVVEPDGTLQALELATGKKLFSTRLDAKTVAEAKQIYLLADALHWYIAFLSASDQPNQGMRFAAVYNVAVLRTLPIHGPLLALDRATGELRWQVDIPQQGLILEQFEELPLVLCASFREVRLGAGPNNPERYRYVSTLLALDKRDGRVIDRTESPNGSQYTALRVDAAAGRIELLGHPLKAGFQLRGD
jgi:outer membrane protein assembly factor BamB